jgi:GNAT superfamily N-acetyltransferase
MSPLVTTLSNEHDVKKFNSGNEALDSWLRQTSRQHQKNSISQTFVLVEEDAPSSILGFYALTLRELTPTDELPPAIQKRLPRKIPGITLARLAVSQTEQGKGFGEELLVDAMTRARDAAKVVGGWGLFIDAKDDDVAKFYIKYGFTPLPSNPLILVIPFASIP